MGAEHGQEARSQLFPVLIRKRIVMSARGSDGDVAMKNDRRERFETLAGRS